MKKTIFISIIMIFMLTCLAGCFGDKTSSNNTLSSDFSSIMQELSKNYEVKAVNGYSTDAIPNIDGYEFKVDGKSFKVLKMQDSDFNDFNPDNSDNEFLSNINVSVKYPNAYAKEPDIGTITPKQLEKAQVVIQAG